MESCGARGGGETPSGRLRAALAQMDLGLSSEGGASFLVVCGPVSLLRFEAPACRSWRSLQGS